jgi:hypothetical protein
MPVNASAGIGEGRVAVMMIDRDLPRLVESIALGVLGAFILGALLPAVRRWIR